MSRSNYRPLGRTVCNRFSYLFSFTWRNIAGMAAGFSWKGQEYNGVECQLPNAIKVSLIL